MKNVLREKKKGRKRVLKSEEPRAGTLRRVAATGKQHFTTRQPTPNTQQASTRPFYGAGHLPNAGLT